MSLNIDPNKALDLVDDYLSEIEELLKLSFSEGNSKKSDLDSRIEGFVRSAFESGDEKGYSSSPSIFVRSLGHVPTENEKQKDYISSLKRMRRHLITFKEEIDVSTYNISKSETDVLNTLERIFSNFHSVVRQLRIRYDDRETLDVSNEYDVQDLLHALLKLFFSDIRPEEYTPSYAGNHRRMDFLLKPEETVIEVKMTRASLKNKEASEQLNDDIATYKEHADCDTLVCFIYDPDGRINNPVGFERDLSNQSTDKLNVKVFVFPK